MDTVLKELLHLKRNKIALRGWTLEDLVQEVHTLVPGLRAVRLLLDRLDAFPAVQETLFSVRTPAAHIPTSFVASFVFCRGSQTQEYPLRHMSTRKAAEDWALEDYAADAVTNEVLDKLASIFPAARYLVDLARRLDGLFLQDSLGRIWDALPEGQFAAQSQWTGTTSTTTATQSSAQIGTHIVFVLAGEGTLIRLAPQPIQQVHVEHSIAEMLLIMARQGRMPRNPLLSLCTAMPRNLNNPQELMVGFMIYPSAGEARDVAVLQDLSSDGTMLQAIMVDAGTRLEHMVGSAQARRGFTPILNGVPRAAANRDLVTGDLIQLEQPPLTTRVVTVAHMYFLLPELRFFAMPLSMPSMAPVSRNPMNPIAVERGREAARRTLQLRTIERRVEVGEPGHDNRPLMVMGPTHPPYFLFMPAPLEPSLREVLLFLSYSGFFDPGTSFAETRALSHGVEIFVSIPPRSTRSTVLLTAPDTTLTYLQVNMPVGMPLQNLGLPVRRGFELVFPPRAAHGAVIKDKDQPQHSASSSLGTAGTSLAQLPDLSRKRADRCKGLSLVTRLASYFYLFLEII
ncbi:unnamed protein product [Symbiodinium sp. CCMP2592]|nr:unnamed protein product [Symbiodinium sp. CCMP2592]